MNVAVTLSLLLASLPLAAGEIYRTYDEQGNVVYTDRKPHDGAESVTLPNLTIAQPAPASTPATAVEVPPLLRILAPAPEAHILGTGNTLEVVLEAEPAPPSDAYIVLYLDDQPLPPITGTTTTLENITRGEHRLRAALHNADGEPLADSKAVIFYMRQASRRQANP